MNSPDQPETSIQASAGIPLKMTNCAIGIALFEDDQGIKESFS